MTLWGARVYRVTWGKKSRWSLSSDRYKLRIRSLRKCFHCTCTEKPIQDDCITPNDKCYVFAPLSLFRYHHFASFWGSNYATFVDHSNPSFVNVMYVTVPVILSSLFKLLSLSTFFSPLPIVLRAADRFSGCRTVKSYVASWRFCTIVSMGRHFWTLLSLIYHLSPQPIVAFLCDSNRALFSPSLWMLLNLFLLYVPRKSYGPGLLQSLST